MADKQNNTKKKYFEFIMREAFIKELGDYLDSLVALGVVVRTEVKRDFGMDYKTLNNICLQERLVSDTSLAKMPYILACSLAEYEKKLKAEEPGVERNKKLRDLPALVDKFKDIYGYHATFCLDLIEKGHDLREIVRHP